MIKFKEIFKLKTMLEDACIPFEWREHWGYKGKELKRLKETMSDLLNHYQICYPSFDEENRYMSIIQGFGTYGAERDLLEAMGGFTSEEMGGDVVMSSVTAEQVFEKIKQHYYKKEKFIMKKTIKVIDEDTLEIKEVVIEEDITGKAAEDVIKAFESALNYDPEEFYKKYREYKHAEAEFNAIYEPFKENLIALHETRSDLPKSVILGGVKLTYVSPSTRTSIDSKKLKEEEPEIAKKFSKTSNAKATIRLEET